MSKAEQTAKRIEPLQAGLACKLALLRPTPPGQALQCNVADYAAPAFFLCPPKPLLSNFYLA